MTEQTTDPDSRIEVFCGRWLIRYCQPELDTLFTKQHTAAPYFQELFCRRVVELFRAEHHLSDNLSGKPERWIDVISGNCLMSQPDCPVGPSEMLICLLAKSLETCDWEAVATEVEIWQEETSPQRKKKKKVKRAVIGIDDSGKRVTFKSAAAACAEIGVDDFRKLHAAIQNDTKFCGRVWSYVAPTEHVEQQPFLETEETVDV